MTASVPTLSSICFDYIKEHSKDLTSLDGIPYKPLVENLINYIFRDGTVNSSILSVLAESHSKALRAANLPWTQLAYQTLATSVLPVIKVMSSQFPKFITHLKLGTTDLCDDDMYLFSGFTNLRVLDLRENQNITDRTVSYLSTMALNMSNGSGLPYLEELYLDHVKGITDKSLKFIGKMNSLSFVSLTSTQVTSEVATTYLCSKGFETVKRYRKPHFQDAADSNDLLNFRLYLHIKNCSHTFDIPQGRKPFQLSYKQVEVLLPPLDFTRKVTHAMIRNNQNNTPSKQKKSEQQKNKRPKFNATTNDFLTMFENEIADD